MGPRAPFRNRESSHNCQDFSVSVRGGESCLRCSKGRVPHEPKRHSVRRRGVQPGSVSLGTGNERWQAERLDQRPAPMLDRPLCRANHAVRCAAFVSCETVRRGQITDPEGRQAPRTRAAGPPPTPFGPACKRASRSRGHEGSARRRRGVWPQLLGRCGPHMNPGSVR